MPIPEVLRQLLQIVHVFREIIGDMRLKHFENAALPSSALEEFGEEATTSQPAEKRL